MAIPTRTITITPSTAGSAHLFAYQPALVATGCGGRSIVWPSHHPLRLPCSEALEVALFALNEPWHVLCRKALHAQHESNRGGLQSPFLRDAVRARLEPLASHGVTASLFNDESTKILYVLPKHNGWLGGVSFAADAEVSRFDRLAQIGLVHESYWHQNVWRWGGTYAHARASQGGDGVGLRDLNSVSFGTSVTLEDSLDIGLSASYDGMSGTSRAASDNSASPAWGASASINYNTGPWTVGGYYQQARAPSGGDPGRKRSPVGRTACVSP